MRDREALIQFLHQMCRLMGVQDVDAEKYNWIFDLMGYRAHRDDDAARRITYAAKFSAEIAAYLRSSCEQMSPPVGPGATVHRACLAAYNDYQIFASLRYQKAQKRHFSFWRPNQLPLLLRYHRFNRALRRAVREVTVAAADVGVASSRIREWMEEGRNDGLDRWLKHIEAYENSPQQPG